MARIQRFPRPGEPATAVPVVLPAEDDGGDESPLLAYWRTVARYRWSILAFALAGAIAGGLLALGAVPVYRAETRILVGYNQPSIAGVQQFEGSPYYWHYYETQADILRSRAVAERVVDRLGLVRAQPAPPPAPVAPAWLEPLLRLWREWAPPEWRDRPAPAAPDPRAAAISSVIGGLRVSGGKESEVLVVAYESPDPRRAAAIANGVAEAYVDFRLESRLATASKATSWLSERLEALQTKLDESERALADYQAREGLVDTRSRESIVSARLGTMTAELIRAQARRAEAEARYAQLSRLESDGGGEALAAMTDNPLVVEAHRDLEKQRQRVRELSERYGEKHPKMIAARTDLRAARARLGDEIAKAVERARRELEVARVQESKLEKLIEAQQEEMRGLSAKAFELAKLEREVEANRRLYESFATRFKEADVARDYDVTSVRIIDPAEAPRVPVKPDRLRMVATWLVAGLFLGVGLAFVRQSLDRTLKTPEEAEERLGLPVLGSLLSVPVRFGRPPPERLALGAPSTSFAEAVNDVRTALLFARADAPPRVLLVSSPLSGEGKTTLASNLALALAGRGRTALVDADLRRGRLHELAGIGRSPGLAEIASGRCALDEALVADREVEGLWHLPSGACPSNPLELLSGERIGAGFEALRREFDFVVVDSAPVLAVSDSLVLGNLVDGVVMAVHAGRTPSAAAEEAVRRLRMTGIEPIGVVMQRVDARRMRAGAGRYPYYDGYYGYAGRGASRR